MGVKASLQRAWEIGMFTDVVLVGGDHTEVGPDGIQNSSTRYIQIVESIQNTNTKWQRHSNDDSIWNSKNLGVSTPADTGSKLSHAWQTPG